MGLEVGVEVERVDGRDLSYGDFVERYLVGNRPVLLTGLMDGWRACRDWVVSEDGRPNLQFFAAHFGDSRVQVADCSIREFTDQKRAEMSVSEFISYWLSLSAGNYGSDSTCSNDSHPVLYLKDWHFVKDFPGYVAYTTPSFFIDDWLNLYLDSYNMHKNPCRNLRNSVYDVSDDVSEEQFPGFKKTIWWKCTQEQNEIIFVPSGWYHQVHNLEDTISINHNWFNGYNLSFVWNLLQKDYNEAKDYIEDIRDICDNFEGLCQRNLAANTGMNYHDFFIFITRFSLANMILLYHIKNEGNSIFHPSIKVQHLIHNLLAIHNITSKMESVEAFTEENLRKCSGESQGGVSDIHKILEEREFSEFCEALARMYSSIGKLQEQDSEKNMSTRSEGYPLPCLSTTGFCKLDLVQACDPKICGPKDLIRLIEHAVANPDSVCRGSQHHFIF